MRTIRRDEGGFVLVVVMLALVFLLMLVTSVMAYGLGSQNLSRYDQNWNGALAAAEAGIDDYIFHLNQDGSYWLYGNSAVPTTDSRYGPAPPDGNQAFTTWVSVPGGASDASFRYDRDKSFLPIDGTIRLRVTGRFRNATRTVDVRIRHRNFLDYLYFTDFETKDPAAYDGGDDYTPAEAQTRCAKYYYGPVGGRRDIPSRTDFTGDSDGDVCTDITFISADVINGPLHSNDALRISGSPTFNGPTSTSYDGSLNGGQRWWGSGTPNFANAGDPRLADPLTMPPNNIELKAETNAGAGGCLFTGPTAISLRSNGTMDVISPFTRITTGTAGQNCSAMTAATPNANLYYTESSGASFRITNMPIPSNGVIYVQSVPSSSSDPNFTSGCPGAMTRPRIGQSSSTVAHPLGFPQLNDQATPAGWYGCRAGDVFLEGTLNGRLTIAADNNIILFGNTSYAGGPSGDDILGLVANNYIEVYHPVRTDGSTSQTDGCDAGDDCNLVIPGTSGGVKSLFSGTTAGTSTMATALTSTALRNPSFVGPLLTVAHSFRVQNYDKGSHSVLGNLSLFGSIAQRYRGPVGTFSGGSILTGYAKAYSYDQRLSYDSPPKFLNPVASAWRVVTWSERPPAYRFNAP
jgi:hypothetical protein